MCSLGGAVATYVAILLQHCLAGNENAYSSKKNLPEIKAITFGCPGVLTKEIADSDECKKLVTSYIVDLDLASRMSYVHMEELREMCFRAAEMMSGSLKEKRADVILHDREKLYPPGNVFHEK